MNNLLKTEVSYNILGWIDEDQGTGKFSCLAKAALCFQDGTLLLQPGILCLYMLEGRRARAPHSLGSFFQKGYS
jgi:hypothetical protein